MSRSSYTQQSLDQLTQANKYVGKSANVGAEVIERIADEVNSSNDRDVAEGMFLAFKTTHRYLQAKTLDAIFAFLATVADRYEYNRDTDARNRFHIEEVKKLFDPRDPAKLYTGLASPRRPAPEPCECDHPVDRDCPACHGTGVVESKTETIGG